MSVTNARLSNILGISLRSVQNKRKGYTPWTVPEYLILCKYFGEEEANNIIRREKEEEIALNYIRRN